MFIYGPWYIVTVGYIILSDLLKILLVLCHRRDFGAKNVLSLSAYAYIPLINTLAHLSGVKITVADDGVGFDPGLTGFQNPLDALAFAGEHWTDVAFLDVKMPALSGLELAVRLKEYNPKINIIFVTGFQDYTSDAFAIHA